MRISRERYNRIICEHDLKFLTGDSFSFTQRTQQSLYGFEGFWIIAVTEFAQLGLRPSVVGFVEIEDRASSGLGSALNLEFGHLTQLDEHRFSHVAPFASCLSLLLAVRSSVNAGPAVDPSMKSA